MRRKKQVGKRCNGKKKENRTTETNARIDFLCGLTIFFVTYDSAYKKD